LPENSAKLREDIAGIIRGNMKKGLRVLAAYLRMAHLISGCHDLEVIFEAAAHELENLIDYKRLALASYHPQFQTFRVEAAYETGEAQLDLKKQLIKLSDSDMLPLLLEKKELIAVDYEAPGKGLINQILLHKGFKTYIICPILTQGEVIGCLNVASFERYAFDEMQLTIIKRFAGIIGDAFRTSSLHTRMETMLADYQEAQDHFLFAEKYRNFIDITRGLLHGFNNQLALIMGRAQILKQFGAETIDRAALDKGLDLILRASNTMAEQISQLQTYARGKTDDGPDQIQLKGLIEEIAELSMPRWKGMGRGNIAFKFNLNDQVRVIGFRRRLREALINILMNAVEAEQETGGAIEVAVSTEQTWACITITDHGIGISHENLLHVFDPFFTTKENGSGLGLSVSYRIIREHRGTMEITSAIGQGTAIKILLPLATDYCGRGGTENRQKKI